MVFVSDEVKGGRPVVRSAGTEEAHQEDHDDDTTYESSLSQASRHPVNLTSHFYTRMVTSQTRS